ncbi:MAG: SH3 domain-containing protein [Thiobacillus sp.]|nr:SH3 domain-containing protein [Thiobacillus sp.]
MRPSFVPASVLLLFLSTASAWASPGTVLRNDRLYTQPSSGSRVAATVTKGNSVDIVSKQGGWLRVTSGRTTGWIRLLSVRAGSGGARGTGVGDVFGAATTRSDPSRVVAVAGLRGLNDEDLKLAKFNAEEMARLEAIEVTASQAQSFARRSGLASVNVPSLPDPKPAQPASSWESN